MSDDLTRLSAAETARRVKRGELKAVRVLEAHLERVRRLDEGLGAFLRLCEPEARAAAADVDARVAAGRPVGRLAGVPVALKDNLCTRGVETTCGSRFLEGWRPSYDAAVVERLRAEDALLIGKTNMDEFAMGSSTEHSAYRPTRNPHDPTRVPGGSSGGSAAAVAARLAPLALGSDTGGSIRQPASFCGVFGLKPSYGAVSRYGLVAYASSLDQIGPFARTAEDAALLLGAIAGHDPRDSTSAPGPRPDYLAEARGDLRGLRVGLPREYFGAGLAVEVETPVRAAAELLRSLGAELREVSLPHTESALDAYYVLAPCEASANLARFDGVRFGRRERGDGSLAGLYGASRARGFGEEVRRRILIGTYALSAGYFDAYYRTAQKVRTLVRRDFAEAFRSVDLLLTPTAPTPPFRFGEKADPLSMYLMDVYNVPCNMAGIAGLSMPCGRTPEGLPVGVQLLGPAGSEGLLLRAAARYQEQAPFPECAL
ncbi:MAG: Asp-tRNA(Asn)/Glu-tRNA(Gln) amidotransferase subunit GatA [Elusimicrobiota bacterium]